MKKIFILPVLFCISLTVAAQESIMFSVYGNIALPTPEFKKAVDNSAGGMGVGFGTNFLVNPKGKKGYSPVFFGVDFSYLTFGRDKQPSINNAPPYKTSFNHYSISGITRLVLTDKALGFTPFIDGMIGAKIFNTRTKIDKNFLGTLFNEEDEVIHTTNDTGLGYGLGLGFFTRHQKDEEGNGTGSFSLRLMYLWGDKTQYVKRGSLTVDNGSVSYETGYTKTNMILLQFGILLN